MPPRQRTFIVPAFGLALAGLVAGHALSYALAIPDPHARTFVLHSTGHDYLPAAGQLALVLAVAAVVAAFAGALVRGRVARSGGIGLGRRVVALQVSAFVGVEVLERLIAGAPLSGLGHGHLLVLGIAVQVGFALLGVALLHALVRAGSRLAASSSIRPLVPRQRGSFSLPAAAFRPVVPVLAGATGLRGPPPSHLPR